MISLLCLCVNRGRVSQLAVKTNTYSTSCWLMTLPATVNNTGQTDETTPHLQTRSNALGLSQEQKHKLQSFT